MDSQIADYLLTLNHEFYQKFGEAFARTRQRVQPGVRRLLPRIAHEAAILDLGCGNGNLAHALLGAGHRGPYVGLDFSASLLAARGDLPPTFRFLQIDLAHEDWSSRALQALASLTASTSPPLFNIVTAFAVLHHLPGADLRLNLLRKAHNVLAEDGLLLHSEWQFLNSPKLTARIQPWSRAGLRADQVESGDYLLDWRANGQGLRYVHHFTEEELRALANASGFTVLETFLSDGHNGRLGLYQVWRKCPSPAP